MRILALAAFALGLAGALLVGAASATAQEADDTLDELSSAGIPLLNSPPAAVPQQVPPGQPGPEGQPPPDTLVDFPIPDPTGWIPNPLDWLPGGLNPVNWGKDIVNAVFTLIGQATLALCLAVMGVRPRLLRLRVTPETHDAPARAG